MFQLVSEVKQIPLAFTVPSGTSLCCSRRAGLENLGVIPGTPIHRLWAQGKGAAPTRTHTLTHTTRGYKARTSAGAHPEECTYKYVPHLSTHIMPQIGACGLTHFFHSCTDIPHNRAIRELTHARAHVPLCAHTLTPRAHTLLRTHRPSYTCTHRARTLTPGAHTVLCTHAP